MIDKDTVNKIVEQHIAQTDYFLVETTVSPGNQIKVIIDHTEGVAIDFCVSLTKVIEQKIDREIEDYELEVSSAGLTTPFKIEAQYKKNIGNLVEVLTKDGKKIVGILTHYETENITVEIEVMERKENEKRKKLVQKTVAIPLSNIKSTKQHIRFK